MRAATKAEASLALRLGGSYVLPFIEVTLKGCRWAFLRGFLRTGGGSGGGVGAVGVASLDGSAGALNLTFLGLGVGALCQVLRSGGGSLGAGEFTSLGLGGEGELWPAPLDEGVGA